MNKAKGDFIPFRIRKFIIIFSAIIIALASLILFFVFINRFSAENNGATVYKRGNEIVARIDNLEISVDDLSADNFKYDAENQRLYYTTESSYSTELYDLYFIEKNRSQIYKPEIIDVGIRQDYYVLADKLYYLKKDIKSQIFNACFCDVSNRLIETFSGNVENIYVLDDNNVYFTKKHSDELVLYLRTDGKSSEVCRKLKNILCFNETEKPHIIYEKSSGFSKDITELYVSYCDNRSELVCDNVYEVLYDKYIPCGNLYYFTASKQTVSWSYVVADEYAQSDVNLQKPDKTDFLSFFGLSAEYNDAVKKYEEKLLRDEIRSVLNEAFENGKFSVPAYNCFVYNENGSFPVAENISSDNILAVSSLGTPQIVYESKNVSSSGVDIGMLVDYAASDSVQEVSAIVMEIISENITSNGFIYRAYADGKFVTKFIDDYHAENVLFSFDFAGNKLYTFVRDSHGERLNLYLNDMDSELNICKRKLIDTNISSYCFCDGHLIYLKTDIGKMTGDIFSVNGNERVKISNEADAFVVENSKDIIIVKNLDSQSQKQICDYYIYKDGKEMNIGKNIVLDSFVYSEKDDAAFITYNNEMYVFGDKEAALINNDVSEIRFLL